jgi:threonine/homoserine/homoserine lactone efflux protein
MPPSRRRHPAKIALIVAGAALLLFGAVRIGTASQEESARRAAAAAEAQPAPAPAAPRP